MHTPNCGGAGKPVIGVKNNAQEEVSSYVGNTDSSWNTSTWQEGLANEEFQRQDVSSSRWDRNPGDADQQVSRYSWNTSTRNRTPEYRVLAENTCKKWGINVVRYVQWLAHNYRYELSPDVLLAWQRTQFLIETIRIDPDPPERVKIYVFKHVHTKPDALAGKCIDVDQEIPVNAKSRSYNSQDVTGVHQEVQAILVSQGNTANAINLAVQTVAMFGEVAFVCRGATHRSAGCACLLASLAYPNAVIKFSTTNTNEAAAELLEQA